MNTLFTMILIFVLFVMGITILIHKITEKFDRKVSSHLIFGITTAICGLIVVGIALYDMLTPGGDLNGMLGQILLMVYIPTIVVMIIGDIIAWRIDKRNIRKDGGRQ